MLKEIYIENYKSLRKTQVHFVDGLNIIIGKNGSGKSNLFEFINKVVGWEYLYGLVNYYMIPLSDAKRPNSNQNIFFKIVSVDANHDSITIESQSVNATESVLSVVLNNSGNLIQVYNSKNPKVVDSFINLFITGVLEASFLQFSLPQNLSILDQTGTVIIDLNNSNTVQPSEDKLYVFQAIIFKIRGLIEGETKAIFDKKDLSDIFQKIILQVDLITNLALHTPVRSIRLGENINIFKVNNKITIENIYFEFLVGQEWMPWSFLSDGTKRLFYIVSQVLFTMDEVILIEEPELGIHPHQLYKLMSFIKEQSEHKQIIISTHSPLILDTLEAHELHRIIVSTIKDGVSTFSSLTDTQIENARQYIENVNLLSHYWLHHSDIEANEV